ncbi:MAG TPA: hypothetical protein VFX85_12820 [Solirubrobacterales bacterium]|nr:hypothetical protein [Solirubrobacterales bacterium]
MRAGVLALALLALFVAGCGEEQSDGRAAPAASEFPAPEGATLAELQKRAGPSDLVVVPVGLTYEEGDRYGFVLSTAARKEIANADVALYFAAGEGPAQGPYPARTESLQASPQFQSQSTGEDPETSKVLYVVDDPPFGRDGEWEVMAMIRAKDGSFDAAMAPGIVVGYYPSRIHGFPVIAENPIAVGEPAPRVHTPTIGDVASAKELDTREPPDRMHEDDLADVLGRKPAIVVFATPAHCQTWACGPVLDATEEASARFGDDVSFIHSEIYKGNDPNAGIRPQVLAFRLHSDTWLFAIDEDGVVQERLEGAWGPAAVEAAAEELLTK